MKKILLLVAIALLSACDDPVVIPPARAEARVALFKECMSLAAQLGRQGDDDVADVVDACATQSMYMTNHIK